VGVDDAVAGVQHADATTHPPPPLDRVVGVARLAVGLALELEDRVAADHQGAGLVRCDRDRLELGQLERQLARSRRFDAVLVDPADDHVRAQPGVAQRLQPCGRLRGEDQAGE
jgi:hypothetical protein